jgi:hypothetical protein
MYKMSETPPVLNAYFHQYKKHSILLIIFGILITIAFYSDSNSDISHFILPGIFLIIWIIGYRSKRKRKQKIARLKEIGIKKEGKFVGVRDLIKTRKSKISQVCVTVSFPEKVTHTTIGIPQKMLYSDFISTSKADRYTKQNTFTVYIDPLNSEEYFVDLDSVQPPIQSFLSAIFQQSSHSPT